MPSQDNKGGKPTKYLPEFIQKVDKYLRKCTDEEYEFHKSRGAVSNTFDEKKRVNLPTKEGFADYLGITRKTLYNWRDKYDEFAEALEKIDNEQLKRLINGGLDGSYNATIARLILSTNHGMREGIDATTKGESINNFNEEQIDRIARRVSRRADGSGRVSK